jgi:diguanylate cyclase (GGDEF)-like protein/PAS domain S-box-containing protein
MTVAAPQHSDRQRNLEGSECIIREERPQAELVMNTTRSKDQGNADERLALFDFAFEHAPIGVALVDMEGRILRGNAAFARMLGRPTDNVRGVHFKDFTHPDDLETDLTFFREVLEGSRDGYTIEKRYVQPGGCIIHARIHVAAMRDPSGKVVRFISQIEDISNQKRIEQELAERAAQLELAMEAVRGGFWQMDIANRRFETSDRLAQFIGGPAAARLDLDNYLRKVVPDDEAATDLAPLISGSVDQSVAEYRLDTVAGEKWMRCDRRLLRDADGQPLRIVGMAIDFTDEHQRLEQSEHKADTDALTGLLNRRGLAKRFEKLSSSEGFTVLAIDLDGFKQINDRLGHAAGDAVLLETARRLTGLVRENDLVCRTGGDEFVVVVTGGQVVAETIAERLVATMRVPIDTEAGSASVRASVGGVWSPAKKVDVEQLISSADAKLYQAKEAGKDTWRIEGG